MAHFYNDANFYPTTSAAGDFEIDWSLHPAAEEVGLQPIDTSLEAIWRMLEEPHPGPMVGLPANDRVHGYDSVAPATLDMIQPDGHHQLQYSGGDLEESYLRPQSAELVRPQPATLAYPPRDAQPPYLSQDWQENHTEPQLPDFVYPPFNAAAFEAPAAAPVPSDARPPPQCHPDPLPLEHVSIHNQPITGPTRTGKGRQQRRQPYGPYSARGTGCVGAAAGPSTLPPPPVPSVGQPTIQPSGGSSETTADAEKNQTTKEEGKIPHKRTGKSSSKRKHLKQLDEAAARLFEWAEKREGPRNLSFGQALGVAVKAIQAVREVVNDQPLLRELDNQLDQNPSVKAFLERERREEWTGLYRELSRYYTPTKSRCWSRPKLLTRVVQDLETDPNLRQDPDSSTSETSAPMMTARLP